jgi:hypothetical protein
MNNLLKNIETCLKEDYTPAFYRRYIGSAQVDELSLDDFKTQIGLTLPASFYEYYEWLLQLPKPEGKPISIFDKDEIEHFACSLKTILRDTKKWQEIQQKQPKREWKAGFVALNSWNDCYQLVIDTLGEVGKAGCVLYWDFKGGGQYIIKYDSFEKFLETKLALLQAQLYFPPDSETDEEAYDSFMYGEVQDQIKEIEDEVNQGVKKHIKFA